MYSDIAVGSPSVNTSVNIRVDTGIIMLSYLDYLLAMAFKEFILIRNQVRFCGFNS